MTNASTISFLTKEIAGIYASYHFTDWDEAVDQAVSTYVEGGGNYTEEELQLAKHYARTLTNKWKQSASEYVTYS